MLFPLHEFVKGHDTVATRKQLEESQWWTSQKLESQRIAKLRNFMIDVGQHVPYYRSLFQQLRFDPSGVASIRDLQELPLLI